ncbi:MAG: hypothetical protein IPL54_17200 [Chitinophagaceae bacterium]|nr:hypothetical protein [Chitinophagaceae bacterium]
MKKNKVFLIIKGVCICLLIIALAIIPTGNSFTKWLTATTLGFALITFAMDLYDYKKKIN